MRKPRNTWDGEGQALLSVLELGSNFMLLWVVMGIGYFDSTTVSYVSHILSTSREGHGKFVNNSPRCLNHAPLFKGTVGEKNSLFSFL